MKTKGDIETEILQSIRDIKAGRGKVIKIETSEDIVDIRQHLHLSQAKFADLMCISIKTLQDWEQGRRKPRGPAVSLLKIAYKHPEIFINHSKH